MTDLSKRVINSSNSFLSPSRKRDSRTAVRIVMSALAWRMHSAILQEQLFGLLAARGQYSLEPLCHRAPQLLFGAGMLVGEQRELGHERALIEQLGLVQRLVEGEHLISG